MRLPDWAGPVLLGLAAVGTAAAVVWLAYQAFMWFATVITYALIGMFVIGAGLDPTVIITSAPAIAPGT